MPAWTPEEAREMGRRGGEARAAALRDRQALGAAAVVRRALDENAAKLIDELVDAALGRGNFATRVVTVGGEKYLETGLAAKERKDALVKLLEMAAGKPGTAEPPKEQKPEEVEEGPSVQVVSGVEEKES